MTKWHTVWTSESGTVRIQQWDDADEFRVESLIRNSARPRWWGHSPDYTSLDAAKEAALKMEAPHA